MDGTLFSIQERLSFSERCTRPEVNVGPADQNKATMITLVAPQVGIEICYRCIVNKNDERQIVTNDMVWVMRIRWGTGLVYDREGSTSYQKISTVRENVAAGTGSCRVLYRASEGITAENCL